MPALCRVAQVCVLGAALSPTTVLAEGECHVVDIDFLPQELATNAPMRAPSQIVAWIEKPDGTFVQTIFITQQTGTFGLGNRPGRFDFNSGPNWPYGRRTMVFPVWSHRHPFEWPEIVFQNGDDNNLSHPFNQSSRDNHYCRPLMSSEPQWDTGSCASAVYTDKGLFGAKKSRYPMRQDFMRTTPDDPSVDMFAMMNPFDAVSQATPPSGMPAEISWPIPEELEPGDYVLWLEVSREFDHNETYSPTAYPAPTGIPWADYGEAFRGQPSVVWKAPFTIGSELSTAYALDYAGYGDPDGLDGDLRAPDGTISTGIAGSGAERLAVQMDNGTPYRLRVITRPEFDFEKPGAAQGIGVVDVSSTEARLSFVAPGDDGLTGKVAGYEIRFVVGEQLDEASFADATEVKHGISPGDAGAIHEFDIPGLIFDTAYTVGVRAFDDCRNKGPLTILSFRTPERALGEVDACFVATAACGTALAADVEMLRRFRDLLLKRTVLGELAVETYYTFGPAVAGVVGESELMRATARAILAPIVATVRALTF